MTYAFKKDGFMAIVSKDPHETQESFNDRGYFIVCQKPNTKAKMEEATIYSRIYVNCKNTDCEYEKEVMNRLNQMKQNLK